MTMNFSVEKENDLKLSSIMYVAKIYNHPFVYVFCSGCPSVDKCCTDKL